MTRAFALPVLAALSCTPPANAAASSACPQPFAADPAREARLVALLEGDAEARSAVHRLPPACFGPTRSPGVLIDGRPMLDLRGSDLELAGRLAHLGVHVQDNLGDGCRLGRERAIASEEKARALERRIRDRGGLGPPPDDVRSVTDDYAARCGE